jgi:sugar/nucleoside kinase (ribokinase family)
MGKAARLGAVGYTAVDNSFQIDSFGILPQVFTENAKASIPFSKIPSVFGKPWDIERVKETIADTARKLSSGVFSGRAINIGYQVARLGGSVELITEVGEDFYQTLPTLQYSYASHLEKAGIHVRPFNVRFPNHVAMLSPELVGKKLLRTHGNQLLSSGILMVSGRCTASVISLCDKMGNDIFFFKDADNASEIAKFRPVPTDLLEKLDSIVVSSGDNRFNQSIVNAAYKRGLDVFFDIGLFEPSHDFLRTVIMKSTIVFGNPKEIAEVCRAFRCVPDKPEQIFARAKPPRLQYIIIMEKERGKATILKRNVSKPYSVGPVSYQRIGTSIGVCDAITGGTLALFLRGYPIETSCKGGMIAGGAVWESDKIQEPMLDWKQLSNRYLHVFDESL